MELDTVGISRLSTGSGESVGSDSAEGTGFVFPGLSLNGLLCSIVNVRQRSEWRGFRQRFCYFEGIALAKSSV